MVADEEQHGRLLADAFGVVRDRGVPEEIVARAELDRVGALSQPDSTRQNEMVLVAGVGVEARPLAWPVRHQGDPQVAWDPAIDLLDADPAGTAPSAARSGAHDTWLL